MSRVGFGRKIVLALALAAVGLFAAQAKAAVVTFASFSAATTPNFSYTTGGTVGSAATITFTQTVNLNLGIGFFDGLAPGGDYTIINPGPSQQQQFLGATVTLTGYKVGTATTVVNGVPQATSSSQDLPEASLGSGTVQVKSSSGHLLFGGSITDMTLNWFGGTVGGVGTVNGVVNYNTGDLASILGGTEDMVLSLSNINFTVGGGSPVVGAPTTSSLLNSFTATATGSFDSETPSGQVGTPLPAAAWGGLSMMGALGLGAAARRRRK